MVAAAMQLKDEIKRKVMTKLAHLKAEAFAHKGPSSQGYGFSSSHVWM